MSAKICLAGTGGTGKTTTANLVSDAIGIPYLPSSSREAYQSLGYTEKDMRHLTDERRKEVQYRIFEFFERDFYKYDNFILDRSPICHLSYLMLYSHNVLSDDDYRDIETRSVKMLKECDLVVYMPIGAIPPSPDGFRAVHLTKDTSIDRLILGHLEYFHANYTVLHPGTPQERANSVVAYLNNLYPQRFQAA